MSCRIELMSKWMLGVKVLTVGERREKCGVGEGKEVPCGVNLEVGIEDTGMGSLSLIDTDTCRKCMHFLALATGEA